jgi:hypothetical protein
MFKLFENPENGEKKTSVEWTEELEYKSTSSFRKFYDKCKAAGRVEHAFLSLKKRQERRCQGRTGRKIKNPDDGLYYSAVEASKIAEVTPSTIYRRIRDYGIKDPRVWEKRVKSNEYAKRSVYDGLSDRDRGDKLLSDSHGSWERENLL